MEADPPAASEDERTRGLTVSTEATRKHRSFAIASILTSVAFVETSVNELFASAHHENLQLGGALPLADRQTLIAAEELVANNRLLDRFQLALMTLGRQPFDRGAQPYQDVHLLVQLRNALVHYKPRWRAAGNEADDSEEESALTRALASKRFDRHPFMGAGNPFFPDQCLGHACTSWCWGAAIAFVDEFLARAGVAPIYDGLRQDLIA